MRALLQSGFGPATNVLAVRDVERPAVPAGHVGVRVLAAGVARGTWLTTHGLPLIARPSYGWHIPKQPIAGLAFAGNVVEVGRDVTTLAFGEAVFGQAPGAFAEFVSVPVTMVARKPVNVSFAQAAAVPVSGMAALQAVRDAGRVRNGQRVLVIGASGGVGSFAVQIAKSYGARVTGVASTSHLELVRSLGADDVIDYTREEVGARPGRYDVVIDIAGNRPISRLRQVLEPAGTVVIVGGTGGRLTMGFGRTIRALLLNALVSHRLVGLLSNPNQEDLAVLSDLMAGEIVVPLILPSVTFEHAADAIERLGSRHGPGTLIVTP